MIEITRFAKVGGPLTKRIWLGSDGRLCSDGSACVMSRGTARRVEMSGLDEFASLLTGLDSHEAIALGALRSDLPDLVDLRTAATLGKLDEPSASAVIARTTDFIAYDAGRPALALVDFDTKGMPPGVAKRLQDAGGLQSALASIIPELVTCGRVIRASTSSGIYHAGTGQAYAGSGGLHVFVLVDDGQQIPRLLHALHCRCWLAGYGWYLVGAGGHLLERSIVDRMVGGPERLVFEGAPVLEGPLKQDDAGRRPVVHPGQPLDTRRACPNLNSAEHARYRELQTAAKRLLGGNATRARQVFIQQHGTKLAERAKLPEAVAARIINRQIDGVLLPEVELAFDDAEFSGTTVADVLADPERFVGATLADPLEGVAYGTCKAKVMQRVNGGLWIHSFAHGRVFYELRHDARSLESILNERSKADLPEVLAQLLPVTDLTLAEKEELLERVCKRAGVGKRALYKIVRQAEQRQSEQRTQDDEQRQAAERTDRRLRLLAPTPDAERLPVVEALDDVLSSAPDCEPPMRDLDGRPVEIRCRQPLLLHTLTQTGTNAAEATDNRLPPPELPLLTLHDKISLAHMIERHVEYVEPKPHGGSRPVALPPGFVEHYIGYRDSTLPRVGAVITMPLVLPKGQVLAPRGLDREHRLVFRIEPEMRGLIPPREQCSDKAVAEALRFLLEEWLVDVATSVEGKCVLIAGALSILERVLLPERPAFFVTAGHRGGGKTTTISMLVLAVTGRKPPAAAWSASDEERRKALFSYLTEALPVLCWDNIPRGEAISCPSIEKALTADSYSDRVLGHSNVQTVPATTIQLFTGNNITPKGDLASRALTARLNVDRPDPENRSFTHTDPIDWTICNRGRILRALYTILLGNPQLRLDGARPPETRFKIWWHLVGSAVEHAAALLQEGAARLSSQSSSDATDRPVPIRFVDLFNSYEAEDEQGSAMADILTMLLTRWSSNAFQGADVARFIQEDQNGLELKTLIEQATNEPMPTVSASTTTWRLKRLVDTPVQCGSRVLRLRMRRLLNHEGCWFEVAAVVQS